MADIAQDGDAAKLDAASFAVIADLLVPLLSQNSELPGFIRESSEHVANTSAASTLSEDGSRLRLKATYVAAQALLFNFENFEPRFERRALVTDVSAGFVFGAEIGKFSFGSWSFGLVIQCDAAEHDESTLTHIGDIAALGTNFPVLALYSRLIEHAPPAVVTSPLSGSCALWVKPRTSSSWSEGLLTARHVVDASFSSVGIRPPGHTAVLWSSAVKHTRCTIDAAVIDAARIPWPSRLAPVRIVGFPSSPAAPGARVELEGQHTTATGNILRIHRDIPYVGILFGQRLITDVHGIPGDSGGTVRVLPSREPCGIYIGAFSATGAGPASHGVAQDLFQVVDYFDLECFQ